MTELLELRKEMKDSKPQFIRQDYQRRKRLGRKIKWRKPKGIHSKIRHHLKGRRKMPSPGYKSPLKVRGLHASGLKIVNISSIKETNEIKKDTEGIIISGQVGLKKKFQILKTAKELGAIVLNVNMDEQLKKIEEFINSKKKKEKTKETKKEEPKEKEAREQKAAAEPSEKEKRESEKQQKDKLLTKRV